MQAAVGAASAANGDSGLAQQLSRAEPAPTGAGVAEPGSWRAQRSNPEASPTSLDCFATLAMKLSRVKSVFVCRPVLSALHRQPTTEENMPATGACRSQLHRVCALQQTQIAAMLISINALSTFQPLAQALRQMSRSSGPGGRCCWGKTPARRTGADARGSCFSQPAFPSPLRVVPFGDGCDGHDHVT